MYMAHLVCVQVYAAGCGGCMLGFLHFKQVIGVLTGCMYMIVQMLLLAYGRHCAYVRYWCLMWRVLNVCRSMYPAFFECRC